MMAPLKWVICIAISLLGVIDPVGQSTSPMEINIDRSVWRSGLIDWPSDEHFVIFYYELPPDVSDCTILSGEFLSRIYTGPMSSTLRMGEACGRLVVVYRDDGLSAATGRLGLEFVGRHESFHLAVQMYGSSVPLEYLREKRNITSSRAKKFFERLSKSFPLAEVEANPPSEMDVCREIVTGYLELPDDVRREIDSLVFWEWPAEYYAYKSLRRYGKINHSSYKKIRLIAGDYYEYSSGVSFGLILDRVIGTRGWQDRVMTGESMLDIWGARCSANYKPLPRISIKIKRMDFPLD